MGIKCLTFALLACCILSGCQTKSESDASRVAEASAEVPPQGKSQSGTADDASVQNALVVTTLAEHGSPYSIEEKETVIFKGSGALFGDSEVRFTVLDDAGDSAAPRTSASLVIPSISELPISAAKDAYNSHFTAMLPKPVDAPLTVTLKLNIDGAEERSVNLVLQKVKESGKH